MTQDEIIEMAEACGFTRTHTGEVRLWLSNTKDLKAFAKLVAAKEREACAKFIEDEYVRQFENPWREDLAATIRARGEA